ncbi:polymerase delta-interacting protein 3 [Halotydeus destructor]|nr:polymerase delta-interacting protein 3 [Halotydeus destructor]
MDARQKLNQKRRQGSNGRASAGRVTRNVSDLRQLIGNKKKASGSGTQTGVKKRLGLQSRAARDTANKGFRSDAISNRTAVKVSSPRVTVSNPGSGRGARPSSHPMSKNRVWRRSEIPPQYVFPQTQPTVIIATQPFGNADVNARGNQIVVSNLNSSITQSDILELFGDIGTIASYTMVNPSTALISYVDSANAANAVRTYHNRALDGQPMQCTLIPTPVIAGSPMASTGGSNRHIAQAFQQALQNTR